jgi:hypothetical protein
VLIIFLRAGFLRRTLTSAAPKCSGRVRFLAIPSFNLQQVWRRALA